MHTHETEHETTSLGPAAKLVAERASTLVRVELELAALELKRKVAALGIGIGLALGAVLFLLYALGFGLAAGAGGIAPALRWWPALWIVLGVLFVLALTRGPGPAIMFGRGTP